jgi:hypothetical protein
MNKLVKDPKKRRQLLIAGGAVTVLMLLLVLRKKTAAPASEANTATSEPLNLPSEHAPEGSGGGGSSGGSAGTPGEFGQIGTQLSQQLAAQNAEQQNAFGALINALSGYNNSLPGAGEPAQAPTQTRTPLAGASLIKNEQPGSPRKGDPYKNATLNGKPAHEYTKAVPHGVGPGNRFIVLPSTHSGSTGAAPAPAIKNADRGNPRKGQDFTKGTYKGKPVHVYTHAVKGGVGTRRNMIVV